MFAARKTDNVSSAANYIEDVFSTYLYTGTGSSQTITNNVDTSTKGGLVWIKGRSGATGHRLTDTVRGATKSLESNSAAAEATESTGLTAFGTTGFTIGADADYNTNAATYVSWTFREQAKFFDVVTYTGNGANRTIAHNLGSTPGCIIVKAYSGGTASTLTWQVYHRSVGNTASLYLNLTDAAFTSSVFWNNTSPTSTQFSLGTSASVNENGTQYVAYLFAHDAGGFGSAGSDNVISCGSFNYNTFPQTVTLGYEPQWLMVKQTDGTGDWIMFDNMRGFTANDSGGRGRRLLANTSGAETANDGLYYGGATGFNLNLPAFGNYIYIAIRRGPMKTPTSGTSVYTSSATTNATGSTITTNFSVDLAFDRPKAVGYNWQWQDRLRGSVLLQSNSTGAEFTPSPLLFSFDNNTAVKLNGFLDGDGNAHAWLFRRAPGFFDVVCYTGNGSASQTVNHNLGVVPELVINKSRSVRGWTVFRGSTTTLSGFLQLNTTAAAGGDSISVSSTTITPTLAAGVGMNTNAENYVTYLFATVAGVSKVGSYTGNGSNQTINCGFTAGARFVMIKRTDSTGDWYVWDTARGIVSGNDPRLSLNSTAAEVTTDDSIDPDNSGFIVNQLSATNINVSSATYIFLAVS